MDYNPTIDFDTTEGLQLYGSALWHALNAISPRDHVWLGNDEYCNRWTINLLLEKHETPFDIRERGKVVKVSDFSFHWFQLYRYQELVQFIFRPCNEPPLLVDRLTPIARNQDIIRRAQLFRLFTESAEAVLNPQIEMPQPKNDFAELTFRTLLHHATQRTRNRGAPRGARYEDFRGEAASRAWERMRFDVLGDKKVVSRRGAVREVLESFEIVSAGHTPTQRHYVFATNETRAIELVVKELEILLDEYPIYDE